MRKAFLIFWKTFFMSNFFKKALLALLVLVVLFVIAYWVIDARQEPYALAEVEQQAQGKFVQLPAGPTHYQDAGKAEKGTVILIHGGMVLGMKAWDKNIRSLEEAGYRVVRYDLYGRGYSARPDQEYTPALFYNQLESLIDSLNLQPPYKLVSISMGGMVALQYAAKHAQQVDQLVMLSPAVLGKFRAQWPLKIPVVRDVLMTFYWYPQAIDSQMEEFYRPEKNQDYRQTLETMARIKGYKASNLSTWMKTLTVSMEPELKQVAQAKIPVFILLGEHDPYLSGKDQEVYQELLPQASILTLPEAGHVLSYEAPDQVNELLLNFLQGNHLSEARQPVDQKTEDLLKSSL